MKRFLTYLGLLLYLLLHTGAYAQAPDISYSTTNNVFTVGSAITALTPTNAGGAVPATTYATVSTFAGSSFGFSGRTNGTGTSTSFNTPRWGTIDGSGNMYVADAGNNEIRKIVVSTGAVTLFAGSSTGASGSTDATGTSAKFNAPYAITNDGAGNLYVADFTNNSIRKIVISTQAVTTIATGLNGPAGIVYNPVDGFLYVANSSSNQILQMATSGTSSVFAGSSSGASGSADGTGTAASFNLPNGIAVDASGNIYVADQNNNEIRKITTGAVVTTFAGSTTSGSADGTGTAASFNTPRGLDVDIAGDLYVTDSGNDLIRFITPSGVVTTVAGTGSSGYTNGVGTAASFNASRGITVDQSSGNIYIFDYSNNAIREMIGTGYLISATLPSGLSFTSTSGKISGTPTTTSSQTSYTITAFNASGNSSTTITIQCVRTNNWTAASNTTSWNTAGNWSANAVPGANDAIQIGVVAYTKNKQPTLSSSTTVYSIKFGSVKAGIITLSSGVTLTIDSNITVNASSSPTITGNASSSNVVLTPGSIVNIASTGTLTLNSLQAFTLESDATGDASIGQISSGAITGTAASAINVQRYLTGGSSTYRGYRLLSSAVYASAVGGNNVSSINYLKNSIYITATTTTGGFDNTSAANPTIYLYRENLTPNYSSFTGSNFRGINDITASPSYTIDADGSGYTIPAGNGLLVFFRGDRSATSFTNETVPTYVPQSVTLTSAGTLNIGQVTVHDWFTPSLSNLSYTAGSPAAVRGYNLVGNPYASAIDWDTFQTVSTTTGVYGSSVGATIYVLDPVSHNYGAYTSGNGGFAGTNNATNIISSGQAFFVVASSASAQLIFNETAKTTTVNTGTNLLMGTPVNYTNNQYLKLRLAKDASNADETTIRFSSLGDLNFNEVVDALYKPGYGSVSLSGISSDKFNLAIDVIPLPKLQAAVVDLNVNANTDGMYSLTLKDIVSVPRLFDVWLIDKYKHDSLDMRQNKTYLFNIVKKDTSTFGSCRFALVIRQNSAYAYRLQAFTARKDSAFRQVQLAWNTVNEGNYTNFTVERSTDNGKTFEVVGGVAAAGQGGYSLTDKNPQIGQNMYRLKSEDINNAITYSNVVTIQYAPLASDIAGNKLIAYPNPATSNMLNLVVNAAIAGNISSFDFRFMNSSGLVIKEITSSQPSWQGNISNLQPGTYIVQVHNGKDQSLIGQTKFVKF